MRTKRLLDEEQRRKANRRKEWLCLTIAFAMPHTKQSKDRFTVVRAHTGDSLTCGERQRQVDDDDNDIANQRAMNNEYRCELSELSPLRKLDHRCRRGDSRRARTTEANEFH